MKVKNERYHEVSKVTGFDITTVDGRNPGGLSQYLQGFIHPWWLGGFLNHQQYHYSFHPCLVRPKRSLHEDMVLDCITVALIEAMGTGLRRYQGGGFYAVLRVMMNGEKNLYADAVATWAGGG